MPKNKPHKGLLKRIKISKTGKVSHKSCGTGHLKSGKTSKRLRQLRKDTVIDNANFGPTPLMRISPRNRSRSPLL